MFYEYSIILQSSNNSAHKLVHDFFLNSVLLKIRVKNTGWDGRSPDINKFNPSPLPNYFQSTGNQRCAADHLHYTSHGKWKILSLHPILSSMSAFAVG